MQFGTALVAGFGLCMSGCAGAQTAASGTPAAVTPAPRVSSSATGHNSHNSGTLELRASVSGRMLEVLRGDTTLARYTIAVGSANHPTPTGAFRIRKIVWNPSWQPPDAAWAKDRKPQAPGSAKNPMRVVKIFFLEPDYYIHGTDDEQSLGAAESHGCIRMDPGQVAELARLIMAHGGAPRDENWFWRVIHFRSEEKTVILDNPVRLVIG